MKNLNMQMLQQKIKFKGKKIATRSETQSYLFWQEWASVGDTADLPKKINF